MLLEQVGRYEIVGALGHGAMGVVYKARDPLIDRIVAVKTIGLDMSREESEAFERRFYREAKSAGRLNHSNIVTIHDVGKSGDVAYIAMEFLTGQSLREILDSGVVLPADKIADIAAQVADGLAYAHENGIVHRDIKPANIMVLASGLVKITDFGIALLPAGSRTLAGAMFGSPRYMSPEQVNGQDVDGRADIYSLGTVLYEMLTGLPPFAGDDLNAVLTQVLNETPVAPSSRNKSIAPGFDYIVAKAMAKDPDDRYGSALAMAADLRNFRDLRPPSVVPREFQSAMPANVPDTASPQSAAGADGTALRQRRNLVFYGVPAALVAALAGWAVLSRRVSDPTQPAANQTHDNSGVEKLAGGSSISSDPPRQEPAPSQPRAPSAPTPSVTKQSPVVAKPTARLALAISPWGEIYVDGRKRGISPPLAEIKLTPGKHTVEIRNTTFQPYAKTVELPAKGYLKIKHKFQ